MGQPSLFAFQGFVEMEVRYASRLAAQFLSELARMASPRLRTRLVNDGPTALVPTSICQCQVLPEHIRHGRMPSEASRDRPLRARRFVD